MISYHIIWKKAIPRSSICSLVWRLVFDAVRVNNTNNVDKIIDLHIFQWNAWTIEYWTIFYLIKFMVFSLILIINDIYWFKQGEQAEH